MEYLRHNEYVEVMDEEWSTGANIRYNFSESNIYDLAELHRFLDENEL